MSARDRYRCTDPWRERGPPAETDRLLLAQVASYVGDRVVYPLVAEWRTDRQMVLYRQVYARFRDRGGHASVAALLGLPMRRPPLASTPEGRRAQRRVRAGEDLRELSALVRGRQRYPTKREFRRAEHAALYARLYRRYRYRGGHAFLASMLGLPMAPRPICGVLHRDVRP